MIVVVALVCCGFARADVRETRHNLIRSKDKTVDDKDVCVFCHTPVIDVANLPKGQAPSKAPAWQKSLDAGFSFVIYDDIGRLGLGKSSVGSQSIACLSCHDANQAFSVGKTTFDHPFGVPYRGSFNSSFNNSMTIRAHSKDESAPSRAAEHLKGLDDFREVSRSTVENRTVWWVAKSGVTARRTRSDLPLYSRVDAESGNTLPFIECSSCHDPHSSNELFLRVPNEESRLCLTCHTK